MLTSARRGILYPNPLRGDSADVPRDFGAVVAALEIDVVYGQGTLAARPTSTPGSPGMAGRVYMATDQTPHAFYYDYGTGWDAVGSLAAGSVGTTQLVDGCVTGGPAGAGVKIATATITHDNIAASTIRTNEILDGTLLPADLAAASFYPTAGLANGSEGFRAIGAGAGQVVAGNDARLGDTRTPTNGSVTPAKMDFTQVFDFTAAGGLKAQGKRVQRHPYAAEHSIESGQAALTGIPAFGTATVSVSYTSPGASGSRAVACYDGVSASFFGSTGSATASGFTAGIGSSAGGGGGYTGSVNWIADIF